MAIKSASSRRRHSKEPDASQDVEALVKELVAHAKHVASQPTRPAPMGRDDNTAPDDVLFDREIDGVRCILARTRKLPGDALRLSPREREVARMIAKGYPNKIIASVLEISVWTVSTHLRRIFAKLGVTSRTAMLSRMFKDGKMD
jgi:two-component system, NarL family, nitrate/nitrite response regulator NarL